MANCRVCLLAIKKNQLKLSCDNCAGDFHAKCVKMTQADVDFLTEKGTLWRCDPCSAERRRSMRLDMSAQAGSLTLEDIMKVLSDIRADQRKTVEDFNKSYEVLHERLEENTNTLQTELGKIENYIKKIEALEAENGALKKKVNDLEIRVDDLEQYSRKNCVELHGIPEDQGENVIELTKIVGKALNFEITENMIDACHRVGRKTEMRGSRGIIVKFVRRIDKEAFIQRRREKKQSFSTRHIGLPMDNPIYINESLSPARRKIFGEARRLRKELGYKYIWMRGGNILLRKEEGSPVIEIKHQADLNKL